MEYGKKYSRYSFASWRKKMSPDSVGNILIKKNRSLAGKTVPSYALFLHKIEYSNKIFNV